MKIHFAYDPDCTDPQSEAVPFAELSISTPGEDWALKTIYPPEALADDEITLLLLRNWPRYVGEVMTASIGRPVSDVPAMFGYGKQPFSIFVSSVEA